MILSPRTTLTSLISIALFAIIPACSDDVNPNGQGGSSSSNAGSGGSAGESSASTSGSGGTAGTGGTGGGGGSTPSTYCAPDAVMTTPNGGNAFDVVTEHYDLYAQTSQNQAEEMGRMLEAAYPAMQAYFEASPPLGAGQRLSVRFFADQASWAAGLMADGIMVPDEAGGYYSPTNGVAYLFKQGNPYYTHVLLIHEAIHQYHFQSRVKNPSLPFWFVEGVAEYLARHDWDNHCINLGVVPLMSWEDLPDVALNSTIDLPGIVNGSITATRADSWAIYQYLERGDNGAHHASFKTFRDAIDSNQPNPSFSMTVGDPATLGPKLAAFVPTVQEPMMPIYIEWMHVGQQAVFADSGPYFSLAVTKAEVSHFETIYDVPTSGAWMLGVVLGYDDDQNYSALLLDGNGKLQTFQAVGGNLTANNVGSAPASAGNGTGSIALDFMAGNQVKATVNGSISTHTVTTAPQSGLALNNSAALFHDIDWK